jgi:cytidylate kinase
MPTKINLLLDKNSSISIAVDGEAGSGKGTFCSKFASIHALYYCQSSIFYRKLAYLVIEKNLSKIDILRNKDLLDLFNEIGDKDVYNERVAQEASRIASDSEVRELLLKPQRDIIKNNKRLIMEGRDIATVIMPDADIKLYFTASIEERAKRRYIQYKNSGKECDLKEIMRSIEERDGRDKERKNAPLSIAKEAIIIDSSTINSDEVFKLAEQKILENSYRSI